MSGWEALVSTALLGTERRPPQPPDGPFAPALAGLDWSDGEGALLAAAAVLSTARAAGVRAAGAPAPEPAPEDPAPLCSAGADAVLARVLDEHDDLLVEWVERAARAGVRAWPRRLPHLLMAATHDRSLRGPALRAGGRLMPWLAQYEDWSWARGDASGDEDWETGGREERAAMLQAVRAADAAAGRALVESTWEQDAPEDRRAFLALLHDGLSLDDEPLLERALDDRRKAVRTAAARLLDRLPASARAQRMAAALAPMVSVSGTLRKRMEIDYPEALDTQLKRDGIEEKGAPHGLGPRAWWVRQMVAAAPLDLWTERLGLAPPQVLSLAPKEVRAGLLAATAAQGDVTWAQAVAEATNDPHVLDDLPAAAAGPAARHLLRRAKNLVTIGHLIGATAGPWDRETSDAFLDAFDRADLVKNRDWLRVHDLRPLARRLDPLLLDRAAAALTRHDGTGIAPNAVTEVLSVLDLRHAITREIP
jgi:hypothetical protein